MKKNIVELNQIEMHLVGGGIQLTEVCSAYIKESGSLISQKVTEFKNYWNNSTIAEKAVMVGAASVTVMAIVLPAAWIGKIVKTGLQIIGGATIAYKIINKMENHE